MGERKKKLIIAVHCALGAREKWTNCDSCSCVDGDAGFPRWERPGVLEQTSKCPAKMVTGDSREWLSLYSHYKAGFMALTGGVMCQPNAYLEAMRIIDQTVNSDHGD